jgi:AcrR family transcriptional regulator
MTELGLRERKKARTRQVIADAAARLFAQRGYEQVAVSDVAREAEVSEQTVYNYFPTKEQLVTDRDQLVQTELSRLIRTRPPGTTPAAAIREFVLDAVEGIRRIPAEQWRGELGFLAAISPTVHRLALEMSDRQATALATAIAETDMVAPEIARLRGIALAGVLQIIITEAGRRTREGQSQNRIADELRPAIEAVLDDLDAWLTPGRSRLRWPGASQIAWPGAPGGRAAGAADRAWGRARQRHARQRTARRGEDHAAGRGGDPGSGARHPGVLRRRGSRGAGGAARGDLGRARLRRRPARRPRPAARPEQSPDQRLKQPAEVSAVRWPDRGDGRLVVDALDVVLPYDQTP